MTKEQIKNLAEGYNGEATYYSNGIMESLMGSLPAIRRSMIPMTD